MRTLFCLFALFLAASINASAGVLKQNNHQRTLFTEDYSGFYVMAHTSLGMDKVRLETCKASGHAKAKCQFLTELSYTKLKSLEAPMLEMLQKYRAEVDDKKNNFWYFMSRFGLKSTDAQAIDEIIAEIEQNGLSRLVLLSEENIRKSAPKMTTPEFARELAARMKAVLESGASPVAAEDCIPQLQRQGI